MYIYVGDAYGGCVIGGRFAEDDSARENFRGAWVVRGLFVFSYVREKMGDVIALNAELFH